MNTFKSGIGCMFTLSKVALDVCSHFKKLDWMYVCTFKSGIGCTHILKWDWIMFTLSKVGLDVFQKWHLMYVNSIKCSI